MSSPALSGATPATPRVSVHAAVRIAATVLAIIASVAFVAAGCPSYRDGAPGQLASGRDDAESAARSAALALDLWTHGRSTQQLTAVQLTDARDEVVKASKDVAQLTVQDQVDLDRQGFLIQAMARLVIDMNAADAAVRAVSGSTGDPGSLGRDILGVAELLAGQDR